MAKGPKGMAAGLIDPRYCCCAVPLVNPGIYSVITEQGVVSLAIGITAIAAPDVVGASFPSFSIYIFAITCFAVTLCQPIGWIGVLREKTSTFKAYAWANLLAVTAAFSVGAALVITSAVKHSTAVTDCQSSFFTGAANSTDSALSSAQNSTLTSQGEALCGPFAWADVGIMGGLWLLLLLVQIYFVYITYVYSTSQVSDHKLYHSVYSENPEAFTMSVLRSTRYNPNSMYSARAGPNADAWDARPSMDSARDEPAPASYYDANKPQDGHGQYDDAYAEGSHAYPNTYEGYEQQPYGSGGGGYAGQGAYVHDQEGYAGAQRGSWADVAANHPGHQQQYSEQFPSPQYVEHPGQAISRDPGDTPTLNQYNPGQGVGYAAEGGLRRPEGVQHHPAEGMFGRKSPRLQ